MLSAKKAHARIHQGRGDAFTTCLDS